MPVQGGRGVTYGVSGGDGGCWLKRHNRTILGVGLAAVPARPTGAREGSFQDRLPPVRPLFVPTSARAVTRSGTSFKSWPKFPVHDPAREQPSQPAKGKTRKSTQTGVKQPTSYDHFGREGSPAAGRRTSAPPGVPAGKNLNHAPARSPPPGTRLPRVSTRRFCPRCEPVDKTEGAKQVPDRSSGKSKQYVMFGIDGESNFDWSRLRLGKRGRPGL
jgi:hypothetical protein